MTTRSTSSRRGASKSAAAKKKHKVSIPGWIWLITGLAVGFFVAFLMGLAPGAVDVRGVAGQDGTDAVKGQEKANKPVFDFYTLLPESEVSLPIEPVVEKTKPVTKPVRKPSTKTAAVKSQPKQYLLQAGSFRNSKDADRLRAQLLLEGLNPRVEKVNVGGGENWYRVQLGPFSDQESLQSTRQILSARKIDSLLLQLK